MDDDIDLQGIDIKDDDMTMFWKIILSRHTKNLRDHGGSSEISHKSFLSGIV